MNANTSQPKVALVIGAGDSTGGAIAKRFAKEGLIACVTRSSTGQVQPLVDIGLAEGRPAVGYGGEQGQEDAASGGSAQGGGGAASLLGAEGRAAPGIAESQTRGELGLMGLRVTGWAAG